MPHYHLPREATLAPARVVVAVNGSPSALRAAEVAALEARRRHVQLQVVHVVPALLSAGASDAVPEVEFAETGAELLERAVDVVKLSGGDLDVVTTRAAGSRVYEVLQAIRDASLLVVGAHTQSLGLGAWAGSVVTGLASRAPCSVLVTPAAATTTAEPYGRVVAGLKKPDASTALAHRAFEVAEDLDAALVLVHGWRLPTAYDRFLAHRSSWEQWSQQQVDAIEELIGDLRRQHPTVPVQIEVKQGTAAKALLDASVTADRLLVARPNHGGYLHHLGSTARAVLGSAACPVEVVPPRSEPRSVKRSADAPGAAR